MTHNPIDLESFDRNTGGDRALQKEVLELFLGQGDEMVSRLTQASSQKLWHEAAHTIKGAARGVGALGLASLAETAELAPFDNARTAHVEAIEREISEIRAVFPTLYP